MFEVSHLLTPFPTGRFAVAVSGGADSVALLRLAMLKPGLSIQIVHLDHETRGGESAADAAFVAALASEFALPCTIARRSAIEPMLPRLSRNRSDHFRQCRYFLFSSVVRREGLDGVLVGHHRGDLAETIAIRLLRGTGSRALSGLRQDSMLQGVRVVRPLLDVAPDALRSLLREMGQSWRDDSSNDSPAQLRSRLRQMLRSRPAIADSLVDLASSVAAMNGWIESVCPRPGDAIDCREVARLPAVVAGHFLARWLKRLSSEPALTERRSLERLRQMCLDASTPSRQMFPGSVLIRRRKQSLIAETTSDPSAAGRVVS